MNVIICRPSGFPIRRILHCPTCKRRRRFAGRDYVWYGPSITCCGCGDSWSDGERHDRPARRGWRTIEIAAAKDLWNEAGAYTKADHEQWLKQEMGVPEDVAVASNVL